jgi:UDP-glucose 4-epimerase
MKYLITGGAGFIGSYLSETLNNLGNSVTVVDNLSTGKNQLNKNITFIKGSILDKSLLDKLILESDYVLHLAAAVGVLNIINNPLESLMTNITGTEIILEICARYNKPILITSSSEIYGKNNIVPLNEKSDRIIGSPLLSRWAYGEAKAIDESMAYFYYQEKNLPIRIVRLFNTVGPRQVGEYGMVLPRFVSNALKNEVLQVFGNGDQIRCFCYVVDAVKAIILIAESDKALGEVFNVGNNQQISILELAKKVIEITGSRSSIEKIAYEKAYPEGFEDIQRRVPDISKIKQVLGWTPEINLDQIIKNIAAFNSKQ